MTGITPAYAGKSHCFAVPRVDVKDHPRLCGEKMVRCFKCGNSPGSPPPMRGKVAQFYFSQIVYRITPAYAGKSFRHLSSATIQQDHPRLCGEKLHMPEKFVWRLGSPPPMRGKGELPCPVNGLNGITPAYAGKSFFDDPPKSLFEDHPRLCGEKANLLGVTTDYLGSPPPMRGKDKITLSVFIFKRITPAYAGKSFATIRSEAPFRDHPRLCGEKRKKSSTA